MKTFELSGVQLDWAVAKCEFEGCEDWDGTLSGVDAVSDMQGGTFNPSTDWAQGGSLIEREGIQIQKHKSGWVALPEDAQFSEEEYQDGSTPLIAAMRCYVASRLGDEVEIPDDLLEEEA